MKLRVVLVGERALLRARTERSLARFALRVDARCTEDDLARALGDEPTWIVRAGAWIAKAPTIEASATKRPLVAFGAIRDDDAWTDLLARSKGEVARERGARVASVVVESPRSLKEALERERFDDAVWRIAQSGDVRAVRAHDLDVGFDGAPHERLRVCVAITALRRGGAERIALDVARGLRARGVAVRFVVASERDERGYDPPDDALFVRASQVPALAHDFGADVIHAHLFDADELRALAALGPPVIATVHNDRVRWATGFDAVTCDELALALGCSRRVTRELRMARPRVRFAPNCVDVERVARGDRARARRELELPHDALVVTCLANPRAQKRLELAVDALVELRRSRDARLVVAGDALPGADGEGAARALCDAIAAARVEPFVRVIPSQRDVRDLFAATDVLLTTSAFEGMSVAQLEALAAQVPVVSTDVGGAFELARTHAAYFVADSDGASIARAIARAATAERPRLDAAFTARAAAARHERALRGAATFDRARLSHESDGLVLVINNFSSGGAQASARRLLCELHARGHRVAAVTLQEQARFPTPWREELARAIPVFAAPSRNDPAASAAAVADFVRACDARTIVFWNAMTSHKLRIADELAGARLFDVSPGEMYFSALDRYFEKRDPDLPYFEPRDYGELLDGVVVKFAAEAERARAALGAPVHVIANGVPAIDRAACARRDRLVVGTLARVSPDKKLEELVDATRVLASAAPVEVHVAGRIERGADAYAKSLRAATRDLPIVWRGEVDTATFLGELDAFAMVSEPEGCPNALLEAMSAGLPIAATRVGGAIEALDGECGLLAPRGDGRALGDALARIARDERLAAALGARAKSRARDAYSIARMTDDYARILFPALNPAP